MKTLIKLIILSSFFAASSAHAWRINHTRLGQFFPLSTAVDVWLSGGILNGNELGYVYTYLPLDTTNYNSIYAALLAAKLSNLSVHIDIPDNCIPTGNSGCPINGVILP